MLRTGLFPSTFWDRDLWVVGITGSPIGWKNIKYSIGASEFEPIFSYDSVLHMMDWICCSGEWPACLVVFSPPLLCLFGYVLGFFVCVCGVFLEVFLWFYFFIYNFPKNTPAYIACKVQTSRKPQFYYITWNSVPASSGFGTYCCLPQHVEPLYHLKKHCQGRCRGALTASSKPLSSISNGKLTSHHGLGFCIEVNQWHQKWMTKLTGFLHKGKDQRT